MINFLKLRQNNWQVLLGLIFIGFFMAPLGPIALPIGNKMSNFWPAIIIQVFGGLWFGTTGIIAGIIFPIFSNYFIGGDIVQIIGFLPANIAQSAFPFLFYRVFKKEPRILNFKDFLFYILFACLLSMLLAGIFGAGALYVFGVKKFETWQYLIDVWGWAIIHIRTLLLIGLPTMLWVSPKILEMNLIETFWSKNRSNYPYYSLPLKIFIAFGFITLVPLIIIGIYQIVILDKTEILRPNHLAIAINIIFFSLLIITSFLTDIIAKPIQSAIADIVKLSAKYSANINFEHFKNEEHFFKNLAKTIEELFQKSLAYERLKVSEEISTQVAHDIRAPLAAVDAILKDTAHFPEEKRIIIRSATGRIRDITNNLLEKNRQAKSATSALFDSKFTEICLLSSLIEPAITEKRLQFRSKIGVEIDSRLATSSYGLFAKIQPVEFKRMLSNLVNNAVEALDEKGSIILSLASVSAEALTDKHKSINIGTGKIIIKVQDTGKGIPPEILKKLGQRGETHGKAGGSGL